MVFKKKTEWQINNDYKKIMNQLLWRPTLITEERKPLYAYIMKLIKQLVNGRDPKKITEICL